MTVRQIDELTERMHQAIAGMLEEPEQAEVVEVAAPTTFVEADRDPPGGAKSKVCRAAMATSKCAPTTTTSGKRETEIFRTKSVPAHAIGMKFVQWLSIEDPDTFFIADFPTSRRASR